MYWIEPAAYSTAPGSAWSRGSSFPHRQLRGLERVLPPTPCSERQPSNCFPLWPEVHVEAVRQRTWMKDQPCVPTGSASSSRHRREGASTCTCRKPHLRESPAGGRGCGPSKSTAPPPAGRAVNRAARATFPASRGAAGFFLKKVPEKKKRSTWFPREV